MGLQIAHSKKPALSYEKITDLAICTLFAVGAGSIPNLFAEISESSIAPAEPRRRRLPSEDCEGYHLGA